MKRTLSAVSVVIPFALLVGLNCSNDDSTAPPSSTGSGGSTGGSSGTATGGSGATATGGSSATATGGSSGATGTGGSSAGGSTAAGGAAGADASAAGGAAGSGGATGTGGAAGSSATGGAAGTAGAGRDTGTGGPADASTGGPEAGGPITIPGFAGIPNNFNELFMSSFMLFPCLGQSGQDCFTAPNGTCPNQSTTLPREQRGLVSHEYFRVGGVPGRNYRVTITVNGITEGKYYLNGTRFAGENLIPNLTVPLDTFYTGGIPRDVENYNIYKIVVHNPPTDPTNLATGTEVQHYYINSMPIAGFAGGQELYEAHNSFLIHFVHDIVVPGGGVVEYLLTDSNCRAIDNCGPGITTSSQCTGNLAGQNPQRIPNEANLPLPASYMGSAMAGLNSVSGATQPWHAQIVHITVTGVAEM